MRDRKPCIIVGNAFARFAQHESVTTASDLRRRLLLRDANAAPQRVLLGQGLSDADREVLIHALGDAFVREPAPRATVELTHKRADEHVLIGCLKSLGDHSYECELDVNDVADRLSDHVTGQHLGGMLLVEAGRQACIAALECEYGVDGPMKWGLAWSGLSVHFQGYVYPVPARLVVSVRETNPGEIKKRSVRVPIEITQAGKRVCELELTITLIEQHVLEGAEDRRARQVIDAVLREEASEAAVAQPA